MLPHPPGGVQGHHAASHRAAVAQGGWEEGHTPWANPAPRCLSFLRCVNRGLGRGEILFLASCDKPERRRSPPRGPLPWWCSKQRTERPPAAPSMWQGLYLVTLSPSLWSQGLRLEQLQGPVCSQPLARLGRGRSTQNRRGRLALGWGAGITFP